MWFITKQKVISPYQTAFKQQHITLDSFLHLHHYASDALSTKIMLPYWQLILKGLSIAL